MAAGNHYGDQSPELTSVSEVTHYAVSNMKGQEHLEEVTNFTTYHYVGRKVVKWSVGQERHGINLILNAIYLIS